MITDCIILDSMISNSMISDNMILHRMISINMIPNMHCLQKSLSMVFSCVYTQFDTYNYEIQILVIEFFNYSDLVSVCISVFLNFLIIILHMQYIFYTDAYFSYDTLFYNICYRYAGT